MDVYKEYKPSVKLTNYIDCIWSETLFNKQINQNKPQLIVPDNSIELIFSDKQISRYNENKKEVYKGKSHLTGLKSKQQYVEFVGSPLIAVRFKPHQLQYFSSIPVAEVINENIPIDEVFGKDIFELEEQLFTAFTNEEKLTYINRFFERKLTVDNQAYALNESILLSFNQIGEALSISKIAELHNMSLKTLERKFYSLIGISPKKFQTLVRFVNVVKQQKINSVQNMTELAFNGYYYDQNHFIKEIKRFTGLSPLKYFNRNKGVQTPIFSA